MDVPSPQVLVRMLLKAICGRHRVSQPLVRHCIMVVGELLLDLL